MMVWEELLNGGSVDGELAGGTRDKPTIKITLTCRCSFSYLGNRIATFGNSIDSDLSNIGRSDDNANPPTAGIGRIKSAVDNLAIFNCVGGKITTACVAYNCANRALCCKAAILNGAILNNNILVLCTRAIVAGGPTNQASKSGACSRNNGRANQMTVVKFHFLHCIGISHECTDT